MRFVSLLNELRDAPVPEGYPDPALLTFKEYEKVANPSRKSHGNSAYQHTGSLDYHKYEDFKPLRRFKSRGIEFELKIKHETHRYAKVHPETEDILRDENGNVMYMDDEDLKAAGINPVHITLGVFDGRKCVGAAQDEWGALLIMVVQEYQGFGLGPIIGKVARTLEPYADSGGFTQGGYYNLQKVHAEFVRDYMANGMYSHLVRTGQLTAERAKEIISSANLTKKPPRPDIGPSGQRMLWSNGTNAWIVYDANLKEVMDEIQEGKLDEVFSQKLVNAFCFLTNENPTYLYELNYNDEEAGKVALMAAMAHTQQVHGDALVIRNENWADVKERVEALGLRVEYNEPFPDGKMPYAPFERLAAQEAAWRKSFDQYNEFQYLMQELAEQLYNQ